MIRSFRSKALAALFASCRTARLPAENAARVARMLRALNAAERPEDVNLPGYRFHVLAGQSKGRYAITVSGNWRITFGWDGQDAIDFDIEDYH
jgi:proteic killer suppression protein